MATAIAGTVVDADGHILEPADLWVKNMPAKFKDRALRTVYDKDAEGEALLVEEDTVVIRAPNAASIGAARFSEEKRRLQWRTLSYNDGDPAGFDPDLRVKEQDREGIDVAVLYPSMGLFLNGIRDKEHAVLACRIYNDWLADYCGHAPDRMIGVATVPWQDPPAAAKELRRAVTQLNFRGVFIRPNAYNDYLINSPDFDVVWAEAQDLGVPVGLHPGGTPEVWGAPQLYQSLAARFGGRFPGYKVTTFLFDNYLSFSLMVGTGVLERFPRLKVIILESGGGWLPHWLDQMDHYGEMIPTERDGLSLLPSEYFHRQCYIACDPDDSAFRFLPQLIGADKILWASDFPHLDVMVPSVTEELRHSLQGVEQDAQRKILGENAIEVYGLQVAATR